MQQVDSTDQNQTMLSGEAMANQFNRNLLRNSGAVDYVLSRGVTMQQIESGRVGLCPPYSSHWFPLLRGRIVVPIRDVHGKVIAFAGRQYEPLQDMTEQSLWDKYGHEPKKAEERVKKWLKSKWINETYPKNRHLFNLDVAKHAARSMGFIVLAEGYFDSIVMEAQGIPNSAALCGVALSEYHCALIARYCSNVVLLLDGDEAGEKAIEKISPLLDEYDLSRHIIKLPPNYDPDDFVIKYGGKKIKKAMFKMIEENTDILNIKVKS